VVSKFRRIARTLNIVVVAGFVVATLAACPYARGEPAGPTPPSAVRTPQAKSSPDTATVQGADSRINTAEIVKRVNKEVGIDLEATTVGWQRGDFATSCSGFVPRPTMPGKKSSRGSMPIGLK
jgi:hypothetical protein